MWLIYGKTTFGKNFLNEINTRKDLNYLIDEDYKLFFDNLKRSVYFYVKITETLDDSDEYMFKPIFEKKSPKFKYEESLFCLYVNKYIEYFIVTCTLW